MNLFEWLMIAHLFGDYLFQTEYEAMNKAIGKFWNKALMFHCLTYTAVFVPVFWHFNLNFSWLALIFGSHMFLDRRWPVIWWRTHIMRGSEESIRNTFWLTIVVDQIFHTVILALIAATQ